MASASLFLRTENGWKACIDGTPGTTTGPNVLNQPSGGGGALPPPDPSLFTVAQSAPVADATGWSALLNATVGRAASATAPGGYAWTVTSTGNSVRTQVGVNQLLPVAANASEITFTAKGVRQSGTGRLVNLVIEWFNDTAYFAYTADDGTTLTSTGQDLPALVALVPTGATKWRANLVMQDIAGGTPADVITVDSFRGVVSKIGSGTVDPVDPGGGGTGGTGTRDARYFPFTSTSIYNTPLVDGLVVGNGLVDDPNMRINTAWVNFATYSHSAHIAGAGTGTVTVTDVGSGHDRTPRQWKIDRYLHPAAEGTDGNLQVINTMADGTVQMIEIWQSQWTSDTSVQGQRVVVANLSGSGVSKGVWPNGIRASGAAGITGLIRTHEINPAHALYKADPVRPASPLISHSLVIACEGYKQMGKGVPVKSGNVGAYGYYGSANNANQFIPGTGGVTDSNAPGWIPGQDRTGFGKSLGWQYPAREQDSSSLASDSYGVHYSGTINMGSHWAIPSNVNIANLGLNDAAYAAAKALQNYGAFVLDQVYQAGPVFYLQYDGPNTYQGTFLTQLRSQAQILANQLRRVTGTTEAAPGGASLTSGKTRRAAFLPELK